MESNTPEGVNVREILLESTAFGQAEAVQIQEAVASPQCREVRQQLIDLEHRIEDGNASERDYLAAGVTAYFLAQHKLANSYLENVGNSGLASYYHGHVFLALQEYDLAASQFEEAAKRGFEEIGSVLQQAGAIRLAGRIDEADDLLTKHSRNGATHAEYSYQKGCIFSDRGDIYTAIEYFERAADMDPYHSGALFRLASQNDLLGNDDEAVKLYERSLSKPPLFLGALINLGLLYEDREQYAPAAFCFRRVLELYPNNERARLYLKDIEAAHGMYYDEDAVRRDRELEQVLKVPITDFELSARSRNCLEAAGIDTLGDLTEVSEQELLSGKNFGETSLREIRAVMESRGLHLGQNVAKKAYAPAYEPEELSPQERAKLDMPVSDLNLSVRARKCIARLTVATVGELIAKSADELLSVRNFGVTSLNEIRAKLGEAGLALRND